MKILGQLAAVALLVLAVLAVASVLLPRLLLPLTAVFAMVVIGRLVWTATRRW
jgi:hypothetical protein